MNYKAVALSLASLLLPLIGYAVRFVPLSVDELTKQADLVLHGSVRERTVERNAQGTVYTRIQIVVAETWKGTANGEFTVVQAGGTLGERTEQVEGQEPLEPGEEVVLFLVLNDRKQGVVIGLSQGKFTVRANQKSREKTVHNLFHGKDPKAPLKLRDLKIQVKGGRP